MNSFDLIAKAYGFLAQPVPSPESWIREQKARGQVVGELAEGALKVHLDSSHGPLLKRWREDGLQIEDGKKVEAISSVWNALELFSEGGLDYLVSGNKAIEFPKVGKEMIEDLKNYLDKKETDRAEGGHAPVSSDMQDYAAQAEGNAFLKNLYGKILSHQQNIAEAGKAFREAVGLMASFGEPYSNLGTLLWQHGQKRNAFLLFAEGLIKNPHSIPCQLNFLDAGHEMQEYKAMITVLETVLPETPDCVEFKHHLAIAYHRTGETEKALRCLNEILSADPADAEALNLLKSFEENSVHTP